MAKNSLSEDGKYVERRWDMVEKQIMSRGVQSSKVTGAMLKVPRHKFVPEDMKNLAYKDNPIPIGEGQTISQPYIVALMTDLLNLEGKEKVLEVGTGSGYQAAVLAEMGCDVYSVEILESLSEKAEKTLRSSGYEEIKLKIGDGHSGWQEHAPYDAIIVTAAPDRVPETLIEQLKVGGRMIIPVGNVDQELMLLKKTEEGIDKRKITPVRFVPMTGEKNT